MCVRGQRTLLSLQALVSVMWPLRLGRGAPQFADRIVSHCDVTDAALARAMYHLHNLCFDLESPETDRAAQLTDLIGCSEATLTVWLLLWDRSGATHARLSCAVPAATSAAGDRGPGPAAAPPLGHARLVGMCGATLYHDSLYCFNLCIDPAYRRQGLGTRLLLRAQGHALAHGRGALTGTVKTAHAANLRFYFGLGAAVQETGFGCFAGEAPSVRLRAGLPSQAAAGRVARRQRRASRAPLCAAGLVVMCAVLGLVAARTRSLRGTCLWRRPGGSQG